jgi:hypothetical protein
MSIAIRTGKRSALYITMAALIAVVVTSIVVRIMLALAGQNDLGRVIDVITFGALSAFFLVFGIYNTKKRKTLQSTGGYVGAGVWALYTILLAAGVV